MSAKTGMQADVQRLELADLLHRAAQAAERQDPGHSQVSPVLRHLAKLAYANAGAEWSGIAEAAFVRVTPVPSQRPVLRQMPA